MEVNRQLTLGQRLHRAIWFRGWTIAELARKTSIPYTTLQGYLGDKRLPGARHLTVLAGVGMNVEWLLTGEFRGPRGMLPHEDWRGSWESGLFGDSWFLDELVCEVLPRVDEFHARHHDKTREILKCAELDAVLGEFFYQAVWVAAKMSGTGTDLDLRASRRRVLIEAVTSWFDTSLDALAYEGIERIRRDDASSDTPTLE